MFENNSTAESIQSALVDKLILFGYTDIVCERVGVGKDTLSITINSGRKTQLKRKERKSLIGECGRAFNWDTFDGLIIIRKGIPLLSGWKCRIR